MGNLCPSSSAQGEAASESLNAGAAGRNSTGQQGLNDMLREHYAGSGVQYFVAHLVNSDLSQSRALILEIGSSGVAFANPKAPFPRFKSFALDEIVGWKASDVQLSIVTLVNKRGKTQQWSLATEAASRIAQILDNQSKAAFESSGLGRVALVEDMSAV
ncbi:hypothetical protein AB1Y20_000658 [Prymnesium parvum]|uniref:Uncharacterized protein n=1 Tax=Prymnesium parvum TaxID=97485 RepID=A0AB34K9Q3_PRYPA